jgi:CRISPR system Cascade subunit CasC
MRQMFRDYFDESDLGVRTKKIVDVVAATIKRFDESKTDEDAKKLAEKVINAAKVTTKDSEAKALFFLSTKQAENLANLILENEDPSAKEAQGALNKGFGVDIALFGRMVADDPALNTDAAAQVAHSISTHRVDNEFDYYTAVDDCAPEDNAGAGMIGTIEYNSSTLYRYATVAVHELSKQIDDPSVVAKVMQEFARAFVTSMPTGKQNTFANRTLPDAALVSIRTDQPINLVGAFERPVKSTGEGGFSRASCEALAKYAGKVYGSFAGAPERSFVVDQNLTELASLGEAVNLPELLELLGDETLQLLRAETESNEV